MRSSRPYIVVVDDNFHYQADDERYTLGSFASLEEAVGASKKLVDTYLAKSYRPGMSAPELFDDYVCHGEDPYVVWTGSVGKGPFSAWRYAATRCSVLCAGAAAVGG